MRGQTTSAAPAAATVILTGLFIILYILFLPPADREALIGSSNATTPDPTVVDPLDVLLEESPGSVSAERDRTETRSLNTVTLTASGEYERVFGAGAFTVFSSRYDQAVFERSFTVDAVPTDGQLLLTFNDVTGDVIVTMNGEQVYASAPQSNSQKRVFDLPIVRGSNTIRVESAERWWIFGRNSASIESIEVVANVYEPRFATSSQRFSIGDANIDRLERAYVQFYLSCQEGSQLLVIRLNEQLLGEQSYRCGQAQQLEFPLDALRTSNEITFRTDEGVAVIQAPTIRFLYEEGTFPLYFFEVTEDQYDDLRNDEKDAILFMRFAGEADLIVDLNGRFVSVDTRNEDTDRFRQDVTRHLEEGNNYLELEPRRDTRIVDLELFLVASD